MNDLRMIKQMRGLKMMACTLLGATTLLLAACGNDDDVNNHITSDGKVDMAKGMVFKVNFADYNSTDTLQTRAGAANDEIDKDTIELSNGLLAEVSVKKDTENLKHTATTTRALANDTYTMLAYRDGELKGTLTGEVTDGVFTPSNAGNEPLELAADTYTFVLFNSGVNQNGNLLTITSANAANSFIGRTTYTVTATSALQEVAFNMQHAMARVRIKLSGYMPIQATAAATLSSINSTDIPSVATYDASTGVWTGGTGASTSVDLTFPTTTNAYPMNNFLTSQSNEYAYFLPSTNPSKLKLKFTGGTIYKENMANAELQLSFTRLASMVANGSYVINVILKPNFLYLMSDGTTGTLKQTTYGGGNKTPIGVVLSRSKRLAMALENANGGTALQWDTISVIGTYVYSNYRSFSFHNSSDIIAMYNDMDGYKYTWEAAGSFDGVTIKANNKELYPAFYAAGHYSDELIAKGISLSGGLENKKWHLPSTGEWTYFYSALAFGDTSLLTGNSYSTNWLCYPHAASFAFTQVRASRLFVLSESFLTSTELVRSAVDGVFIFWNAMSYGVKLKYFPYKVRPFIYY